MRASNKVVIGKQVFFLDELPLVPISDNDRQTLKRLGIPIRNPGIVAMGTKSLARTKKAGLDFPAVFRVISKETLRRRPS